MLLAKEVFSTSKHSDRVWNVSWNPTGTQLASCGGDKTVYIWCQEGWQPFFLDIKLSDNLVLCSWSTADVPITWATEIIFCATTINFPFCLFRSPTLDDSDIQGMRCMWLLPWVASCAVVYCLICFCSGNNWVQKCSLDGAHVRTVRCTAWSPCGNYIASASFDATTVIWEKKIGTFELILSC